jgi:hypothetical protein
MEEALQERRLARTTLRPYCEARQVDAAEHELLGYGARAQTRSYHLNLLLAHLGWRRATDPDPAALQECSASERPSTAARSAAWRSERSARHDRNRSTQMRSVVESWVASASTSATNGASNVAIRGCTLDAALSTARRRSAGSRWRKIIPAFC